MVVQAMLRDEMWKEQPPQQAAGREAMSTRMKMSKSRRQKRLAGQSIARKYQRRAAIRQAEYRRLKAIVPSVADKKSVTKLMVIEEAIRYIDNLHEMLQSRLGHSQLHQTHSRQDLSNDASRLLPVCCQPDDHSFIRRLLFPVCAVTGSDVMTPITLSNDHSQTAPSCSSRVSRVIRL